MENDETVFIFSSFNQEKFIIDNLKKISTTDFFTNLKLKENKNSYTQNYIQEIRNAVAAIKSGLFDKVVISRVSEEKYSEINLEKIFFSACEKFPSCFVYMLYTEENYFWFGASPELLLEEKNNIYRTASLAGTVENNAIWTDKEINEHQFVSDYITKNIADFHAKNIAVYTHEKIMGELKHLENIYQFEVDKNASLITIDTTNIFLSLLANLHPTPAICGTPKEIAKNYILKNENFNRSFYTGFLGMLNHENKNFMYVNIRCAEIFQNKILLYAGAGITTDSIPEKEFIETEKKMNLLRQLFN